MWCEASHFMKIFYLLQQVTTIGKLKIEVFIYQLLLSSSVRTVIFTKRVESILAKYILK